MFDAFDLKDKDGVIKHVEVLSAYAVGAVDLVIAPELDKLIEDINQFHIKYKKEFAAKSAAIEKYKKDFPAEAATIADFPIIDLGPTCEKSKKVLKEISNLTDTYSTATAGFPKASYDKIFFPSEGGLSTEDYIKSVAEISETPLFEEEYKKLASDYLVLITRIHKLICNQETLDDSESLFHTIRTRIAEGRPPAIVRSETGEVSAVVDEVLIKNLTAALVGKYSVSEIKTLCCVGLAGLEKQEAELLLIEREEYIAKLEAQIVAMQAQQASAAADSSEVTALVGTVAVHMPPHPHASEATATQGVTKKARVALPE